MSNTKARGSFSTKSAPLIMSNPPHPNSQVQGETIKAKNLDQLKDLYQEHGLKAQGKSKKINLASLPDSASKMEKSHLDQLEAATRGFLNGESDLPDSTKKMVTELYGSTSVQKYDVENIVVTPSNPWVISGQGPVVVNVDKVTVEPGGQIQVLTDASIKIAELIKQ